MECPKYNFLFKYPTRARPNVFKKTFEKYSSMLSGKHTYEWVVTMDVDDKTMNNESMISWIDSHPNINYCFGQSSCKVQAINANMENRSFDILLLISDDMHPCVDHYDNIIAENMFKHFPDLSGCLHFNDGRVGDVLNTLSIMGKGLYDRFGYIYHPDYTSLWCDNEFTEVTKNWGKTAYIDHVIIKHEWINVTGEDALHKRNETYYESDKSIFQARQNLGFPAESLTERQRKFLVPSGRKRRDRRFPRH